MQITDSHYRSGALNGAFTFDPAFFSLIEGVLKDFFGNDCDIEFIMTMNNGRTYKTTDIEELDRFPFSDRRTIATFQINVNGESRVSCEVRYSRWTQMPVSVYVHSSYGALTILDTLMVVFKGAESWYSVLFKHEFVVGTLVAISFQLCAQILYRYFELNNGLFISIVAGIIGWILFFAVKHFLFDKIVVLVGPAIVRQQHLMVLRKFLFGTLILGFVSVIAKMFLEVFHLKFPN